jgi:hypothetical protein
VNTNEMSELLSLCSFCTIISTMASLLPKGHSLQTTRYDDCLNRGCFGRKFVCLFCFFKILGTCGSTKFKRGKEMLRNTGRV